MLTNKSQLLQNADGPTCCCKVFKKFFSDFRAEFKIKFQREMLLFLGIPNFHLEGSLHVKNWLYACMQPFR